CDVRDKIARRSSTLANEKWLWHGCRATDPAEIKSSNVDFRHSDHGMYGRGAYFAVNAVYSTSYASKRSSNGVFRSMFLCRVAVGKPEARRRQSNDSIVKPAAGFDSVWGRVATSSDAYIVYNHNQCYPEYEVWYRYRVSR